MPHFTALIRPHEVSHNNATCEVYFLHVAEFSTGDVNDLFEIIAISIRSMKYTLMGDVF